jgi:AAA+ ATPase superfamily predicted ATPase
MGRTFVNRERELKRLEEWWHQRDANLGLVWGRRRVGKTALLQRFSADKPVVYHTGSSRPLADELKTITRQVSSLGESVFRDFDERPFTDWPDCLETLAEMAHERPVLLVLDEFPELTISAPELGSVLRAFWDRQRTQTRLRILLCGSAVRTMKAIQEERAPLYGRIDLSLRLDPFDPHEAARMLPGLKPAQRALVWGLVGGVPLYLEWWDQSATARKNVERLVCTPSGRLLTEGDFVLAAEGGSGDLARQVLHAVAAGRTRYNEIEQAVGASPSRVIDNLIELRLLERLAPVTEEGKRTRRKSYRIADNFLAFWLGVVSKYRTEIDRGLGKTILPVLMSDLDDFMGPRWEDAFRQHLRRLARRGELGKDIVAIGPFWTEGEESVEIDAVALAGRSRRAVLVGEAKWARKVSGERIRRSLEEKARVLPKAADDLIFAACAREAVSPFENVRAFTARHVFSI